MSESTISDRVPVSPDSALPAFAAAAIVLWVLLEFAFRRGLVARLADPLATPLGADAIMLAFGFPLIAALVAWWGMRVGIDRPDWEYDVSLKPVGAGVAGLLLYAVVYGGLAFLFTTVFGIESSLDPGAFGVASAPTWAVALFFLGNAVVVPITEEFAWRGVIQTALTDSYGTYAAIAVTAVAFVGKHLVVDVAAPLFRVTSLVVFAFVLSGLRARYGTASSTVAHLAGNVLTTGSLLLLL